MDLTGRQISIAMALNAELIPGCPRLAHEMGSMSEIAVFRRFFDLNYQNLLYYQAELTMLEAQLRKMEKQTSDASKSAASGARKTIQESYATDWYCLGEYDPENPQWKLVLRLRDVLKEYSQSQQNLSSLWSLVHIDAVHANHGADVST